LTVPSYYEFFPTPPWVVAQFLRQVELPGGFWLEPAYGNGAIVRAVKSMRDDVTWMTNDIQPGAILQTDYTSQPGALLGSQCFDVCLTNPPFSLSLLFAAQALRDAKAVALLLRLCWLSGKEDRRGFLKEHPPAVWLLPNRPTFTGDGKTDSQEYAWFCWGCGGDPGTHHQLEPMGVEERRQWG